MRGRRWVWKGLAFAGFAVIALAVLSWVVMLLWNALLPSLFGVRPLHYLQAAGLLVLSRILLGGLRGHHGPWRHRGWRERWQSLTPEERERLREKYGRHCRWHGMDDASDNQQV
ncbi:MAG TPA: hypothetical protein VMU52_02390 [Steroidobacteraceae bacterium]|nr:hypothetical protein [Steroidobacteraceae bacterium]